MNLALALKNFGKNVEFTTVWEEGHNTAERGGSSYSTTNFISWVAKCMGVENTSDSSSSSSSDSSSSSSDSSSGIHIKIAIFNIILIIGLIM